jgi:hypothetical protein
MTDLLKNLTFYKWGNSSLQIEKREQLNIYGSCAFCGEFAI